ncbi:T9SS type A sorting domain-containing protein [Spirosoma sp. HMF3257]|uniref:SD-repeat containing protein B domain-containing protein n=1 Tax=Spirosoma telluris TaxID=2183553 RepID=A0A327NIC3_9BACT|nr:T9SS type A sorting domain-containing protein [Spirosoma telluris]RAI73766.1 hypothetical protein HMF3257_03960 [Spirosoma telluris]
MGDFVWNDANANGQQDANELGVPNVTVQLINATTGAVVSTTTTDASGKYILPNIDPGTYIIKYTAPGGYTFTTPLTGPTGTDSNVTSSTGNVGSTAPFSITAGQQELTVDAGLKPVGAIIGDFVWNDTNGNGFRIRASQVFQVW